MWESIFSVLGIIAGIVMVVLGKDANGAQKKAGIVLIIVCVTLFAVAEIGGKDVPEKETATKKQESSTSTTEETKVDTFIAPITTAPALVAPSTTPAIATTTAPIMPPTTNAPLTTNLQAIMTTPITTTAQATMATPTTTTAQATRTTPTTTTAQATMATSTTTTAQATMTTPTTTTAQATMTTPTTMAASTTTTAPTTTTVQTTITTPREKSRLATPVSFSKIEAVASGKEITIRWEPVSGSVKYAVNYTIDNQFYQTDTTSTSYTIKIPSIEGLLYIDVFALENTNYSQSYPLVFNNISIIKKLEAPRLKSNPIVAKLGGQITISWEGVLYAQEYTVNSSFNGVDYKSIRTNDTTCTFDAPLSTGDIVIDVFAHGNYADNDGYIQSEPLKIYIKVEV